MIDLRAPEGRPPSHVSRSWAPGRCTLIGDHTDYNQGRSLTAALDMGTTATFAAGDGESLTIKSSHAPDTLELHYPVDPTAFPPGSLGAFVSGLLATYGESPTYRGTLSIDGDLPLGAGLSSSASLLIATALSLGGDEPLLEIARRCSRAEDPLGEIGGLLDQLAILTGEPDMLSLLDFADLSWTHVPMVEDAELTLVHSGQSRVLAASRYAERRAQCAAAASLIGPLDRASREVVLSLDDAVLRSRATHVVSENHRVDMAVEAIRAGDVPSLGDLMNESHRSLSVAFDVSTPEIDEKQALIQALYGVHGTRLVGGGFGGCLIVLSEPGALGAVELGQRWTIRPGGGARVLP